MLLPRLLAGLVLAGACLPALVWADPPPPNRFEKEIAAFEKKDQESPPKDNGILFIGSSTIRLWKLAKSFPNQDLLNRGFGGSQIADAVHFAPRIVVKYKPRLILFYAGDNDVAAGKTPEKVLADFQAFVDIVHKELPKTRIVFISIKPSLARLKLLDKQTRANELVEAYCKGKDYLGYLDITKALLGTDGKPRIELYAKDGLHLSEEGYRQWTGLVGPLLK